MCCNSVLHWCLRIKVAVYMMPKNCTSKGIRFESSPTPATLTDGSRLLLNPPGKIRVSQLDHDRFLTIPSNQSVIHKTSLRRHFHKPSHNVEHSVVKETIQEGTLTRRKEVPWMVGKTTSQVQLVYVNQYTPPMSPGKAITRSTLQIFP